MYLANTKLALNNSKNESGFTTNIFDKTWREPRTENEKRICSILYTIEKRKDWTVVERQKFYKEVAKQFNLEYMINQLPKDEELRDAIDTQKVQQTIQKLMNFFSEFEFEPNFRFLNTFAYKACSSRNSAKEYILNYFSLIDNGYANSVNEKMNCEEFNNLLDEFSQIVPTHKVNNRIKLYYGSQGTGKTTEAMKEANGNCMVCHSAMLPSDLMEDFKFEDGKANFIPSALQRAMVNGQIIVLDEINLLPFESLRFLQTITDEKEQFTYKGQDIKISPNFKIIGTMNLKVNGNIYSLPEPLVDRCEDLREFKLTAENLVGALI